MSEELTTAERELDYEIWEKASGYTGPIQNEH